MARAVAETRAWPAADGPWSHLVGIIREHPASGATFERVHTQGTINVLEAAAAVGRAAATCT